MMLCYTTSLYGQFQCVGTLYVSLPPGDQYILFPEDLLSEGDLTGYTATLSQSEFTCEDLGPNSITLTSLKMESLCFHALQMSLWKTNSIPWQYVLPHLPLN
jgi:hypothetical protein